MAEYSNQGLLSLALEQSSSQYSSLTEEDILNGISPRSTEDSVAFEINGVIHWYNQAEEEALINFNASRDRFNEFVMSGNDRSSTNLIEELTPLQNQLNDLHYQAAYKIEAAKKQEKRFSEKMGYTKEVKFLANIEK